MTMKTETRDQEIDEAACMLHNVGATLAGNTQEGDVEWLARWLFGSSNFGMDSGDTFQWSISNDEFEKLGLLPDRLWTGRRWETLEPDESETWKKLARAFMRCRMLRKESATDSWSKPKLCELSSARGSWKTSTRLATMLTNPRHQNEIPVRRR